MPAIKLRGFTAEAILSQFRDALREAADRIDATAKDATPTTASPEEIEAHMGTLKVEVVNLTEAAKQARVAIASELGAIDAVLADNGTITMTNATGGTSVTLNDEGVTVEAASLDGVSAPAHLEAKGARRPMALTAHARYVVLGIDPYPGRTFSAGASPETLHERIKGAFKREDFPIVHHAGHSPLIQIFRDYWRYEPSGERGDTALVTVLPLTGAPVEERLARLREALLPLGLKLINAS